MIYGDHASPYGHARIKKIDATKAKAVPGVLAVLIAADLKSLGLHYMPTLPATSRRCWPGRCCTRTKSRLIIAESPRGRRWPAGRSGYEGCRSSSIPSRWRRALRFCARHQGQDRRRPRQRKHQPHCLGDRRQGGDRHGLQEGGSDDQGADLPSACPSCPLETCQCVASSIRSRGELTVWGVQALIIRTVASLISKIPEHKIHVIAPTSAAASAKRSAPIPATSARSSPRS